MGQRLATLQDTVLNISSDLYANGEKGENRQHIRKKFNYNLERLLSSYIL